MGHRHGEGKPCVHMEPLLQQVADGSLKGIRLWYAAAHAARCGPCGNYLSRLKETITSLRNLKRESPPSDVLSRLEKNIPRS
jgi:hypothetical protein